ncbi:MAG: hypothetical protein ACOYMV_05350 [Verrucomicrobiia bacterium]
MALEIPHYVVGFLLVEAEGAAGGEILDFHYSEGMREGRPAWYEPGNAGRIALAGRLRLATGRTEHEFFYPMGFAILKVGARDLKRPLTLRLQVRSAWPSSVVIGRPCGQRARPGRISNGTRGGSASHA